MWDYLEHSIDARADIERAYEILAPNGIIALSTGDIESRVARWSGRRWHLLTPRHHNYFFGRTTLMRMLGRAGFEPVRTAYEAGWYSVEHLLFKLEGFGSSGVWRRLAHGLRRTPLSDLQVPVNLYDIVTVVARKRVAA